MPYSAPSTKAFADLACFVALNRAGRDPAFLSRAQFWIDQFGDQDITTITGEQVEDAFMILRQKRKMKVIPNWSGDQAQLVETDQPLATSTLNRSLSTLGGIFRELREMGLLRRSHVSPLRGFGRLKETGGKTITVAADDVQRLVAASRLSRNPKLAAWVAFAAQSGWRRGNIESLTWGQLDLDNGFADTERTKNGTAHRIPLLPWVIVELKRIKAKDVEGGDLVFGPTNITKSFKAALRLAGLPESWTLHSLRHVAASILSQSGANVQTVMAALNHKTPSMALHYSHLNTDSVRDSLKRAWR